MHARTGRKKCRRPRLLGPAGLRVVIESGAIMLAAQLLDEGPRRAMGLADWFVLIWVWFVIGLTIWLLRWERGSTQRATETTEGEKR